MIPCLVEYYDDHILIDVLFNIYIGCPKASGDYKWLSPDMGIVAVSSYAVIQVKRPGIAIVKTVSNRDPHNSDEVMKPVNHYFS